ncbi:unnamed protein product [Urochloa humidicola]
MSLVSLCISSYDEFGIGNEAKTYTIIRSRVNTKRLVMVGAGATEFLMNAQHAEVVACFKGIEHGARMDLDKIVVESDAAMVVVFLLLSRTTHGLVSLYCIHELP